MAGRHRKEGVAPTDDNSELKGAIRSHLMENLDQMFEDIESLEPKDRVDRRLRLMEYVMPKVQSVKTDESKSVSVKEAFMSRMAQYEDT